MTGAGDVPAEDVFDLLARANFAPTGIAYESGEYWAHSDRRLHLPIPFPVAGYFPHSVYDQLVQYIDHYGL